MSASALTEQDIIGVWEAKIAPDVYVAIDFYPAHRATFLFIRSEIFPDWKIQDDVVELSFPDTDRHVSTNRLVRLKKDDAGLHFLRSGLFDVMPDQMERAYLTRVGVLGFRSIEDAHGGMYYDLIGKELPPTLPGKYLELLARLWRHNHGSMATISSHPNADPMTLEHAYSLLPKKDWKGEDKSLALAVLQNIHTPHDILEDAWKSLNGPQYWRAIACNSATSNRYYDIFTNKVLSGSIRVRCNAAEDPLLPVNLMECLARDKDAYVARQLAYNKNCPSEIVAILAIHLDDSVRHAVAVHPNMKPETKAQLEITNRHYAQQEAQDHDLLNAARAGNATNVENALRLGANPNYTERVPALGGGDTPLFVATMANSVNCVRILRAHGADPLQRSEKVPWKFAIAAANLPSKAFNVELFDLLLSGVKQLPAADDGIIDFVVCPSVKRGDTNTLIKLANLGVNLGAISQSGNTIITAALECGRFAEAKTWLQQYRQQFAKNNVKSIRVDEAVEFVVAHPWQDSEFAALLGQIVSIGLVPIPNDRGNTPIWKRAQNYRLPATSIALGCPPDEAAKIVPRSSEELMVATAIYPDSLPLFTNLAERILSDSTNKTQTASRLFMALISDYFKSPRKETLGYFLSHGADVNQESQTPRWGICTPLQVAVMKGDLDMADWLLKQGSDINHVNLKPKTTTLEFAVMQGKQDIVRWVLDHGAVIQEKQTGRSLLKPALVRKETEALIPFLIEKGADPYLGMESKQSALDWLAEKHDILRLRTLDTRGVYRKLVKEYTPPKDSPFIGIWSNQKSGFSTFSLTLTPDGQAIIGLSVMPMGFFPWKTTKSDQAVIEVTMEKQRADWTVEWIAKSNAVCLVQRNVEKSELLFKQAEQPLSATEYIKRFEAKH